MRNFTLSLLGLLLIALLLISCKTRVKTVNESWESPDLEAYDSSAVSLGGIVEVLDTVPPPPPLNDVLGEYLFSVSFISRGEGISTEVRDSIYNILAPFEEEEIISVLTVIWGREGELDYCVYMVKASEQKLPDDVEAKVKAIASRYDKAFFSKEACRHQH